MQGESGFGMPFSNMVEDGQFAYNNGTVRVMCHKETNTDWSSPQASSGVDQSQTEMPGDAAGGGQSQSDGSHSSSIRRWQTFSPGITEDSYVCKVGAD